LRELTQTCLKNKEEFDSKSGALIEEQEQQQVDKFCSNVVYKIQLARQFSGKFKRIQNTAQLLLSDLAGFGGLKQMCNDNIADLKSQEDDFFSSWHN